jgi:hypothetical protein
MKVVRLSAQRTGRLYAPENIPGTHLCSTLSRPQGHSAAGRIMSMKNSNDTIGNRTRDLPACSTVPQPTASPEWKVLSACRTVTFITFQHPCFVLSFFLPGVTHFGIAEGCSDKCPIISEALTNVIIHTTVLWVVTPYSTVPVGKQLFRAICCLHLQGKLLHCAITQTVQVSLCTPLRHMGSGDMVPLFLNPGCFTSQPFYPRLSFNGVWMGHRDGLRKITCTCLESNHDSAASSNTRHSIKHREPIHLGLRYALETWTCNATNKKFPLPAATITLICINHIYYVRNVLNHILTISFY